MTRYLFTPGHTACAGCGMAIIVRHILEEMGKDTIVVNATGCLEIVSSNYPYSAFEVPYIHGTFENSASVATGVVHGLKVQKNEHTKVLVLAGDGATYDIGFGALSAMFDRNEDVLYVCYDNEAYMNTGYQKSASTPTGAITSTTPWGTKISGNPFSKKPIVEIAAAHKIPYAASANVAFLPDLHAKIKKAKEIKGSRFIDVLSPCIPGWGYEPSKTIELAKLAVETGLWKLFEIENGIYKENYKPKELKPVEEYLKMQKRFKQLSEEQVKKIKESVKN